MNTRKQKLCRDVCNALVTHKNKWLESCGMDPCRIGNDPSFQEYKKYLQILGIKKPSAILRKPDNVPGRSKWKLSHWNYLRNLNLEDHPLMIEAAATELTAIVTHGTSPNIASSTTTTYLSSYNDQSASNDEDETNESSTTIVHSPTIKERNNSIFGSSAGISWEHKGTSGVNCDGELFQNQQESHHNVNVADSSNLIPPKSTEMDGTTYGSSTARYTTSRSIMDNHKIAPTQLQDSITTPSSSTPSNSTVPTTNHAL